MSFGIPAVELIIVKPTLWGRQRTRSNGISSETQANRRWQYCRSPYRK